MKSETSSVYTFFLFLTDLTKLIFSPSTTQIKSQFNSLLCLLQILSSFTSTENIIQLKILNIYPTTTNPVSKRPTEASTQKKRQFSDEVHGPSRRTVDPGWWMRAENCGAPRENCWYDQCWSVLQYTTFLQRGENSNPRNGLHRKKRVSNLICIPYACIHAKTIHY